MAQRKSVRKTSNKRRTSNPATKNAAASRKTKAGTGKKTGPSAAKNVGDDEVTIDRRRAPGRREEKVTAAEKSPAPAQNLERRKKVNRRRQIDPTTCERDYTGDEIEFMNALDDYKRKSGRMFPTCSEVLEVVRTLGYIKLSAADLSAGQCGSTSMTGGSATTKWFAESAEGVEEHVDEVEEVESMFEAALAD